MFPSPAESRHSELNDWLDIATSGLSDDAKERIAEEVACHYEDALRDAQGRGLSERAALDEAILSLGHPRAARRQFCEQHLTTREQRLIDGKGILPGHALPGYLFLITMLLWAASTHAESLMTNQAMWIVVAAVGLGLYIMSIRIYRWGRWLRRQDPRIRLWYRAFHQLLFGTFCFVFLIVAAARSLSTINISDYVSYTALAQLSHKLEGWFLFITFRESPDNLFTVPVDLFPALESIFFSLLFGYILFDGISAMRTYAKLGRIRPRSFPTTPVT